MHIIIILFLWWMTLNDSFVIEYFLSVAHGEICKVICIFLWVITRYVRPSFWFPRSLWFKPKEDRSWKRKSLKVAQSFNLKKKTKYSQIIVLVLQMSLIKLNSQATKAFYIVSMKQERNTGEVAAFPTVSLQITIFKHKILNQHN